MKLAKLDWAHFSIVPQIPKWIEVCETGAALEHLVALWTTVSAVCPAVYAFIETSEIEAPQSVAAQLWRLDAVWRCLRDAAVNTDPKMKMKQTCDSLWRAGP